MNMNTLKEICKNVFGFKKYYYEFDNQPGIKYYCTALDWIKSLFLCGASAEDYFIYHFNEKSAKERKQFVTCLKSIWLIRKLNHGSKRYLVEDKTIFVDAFKEFIKRESVSSEKLSLDEFKTFSKRHGKVIIKPADGFNGNGVFVVQASNEADLTNAYRQIRKGKYVIEEVLVQQGFLRELNPGTLNTLRINIIRINGVVYFVNAILRCGQKAGKVTDNICAGGCVAQVNIKTGVIESGFVDLHRSLGIAHPTSKIVVQGMKIPLWQELLDTVKEASAIIDDVKYQSWDVAIIVKDGVQQVAVVEGNTYGNFNIQQIVYKQGVLDEYKQFFR